MYKVKMLSGVPYKIDVHTHASTSESVQGRTQKKISRGGNEKISGRLRQKFFLGP